MDKLLFLLLIGLLVSFSSQAQNDSIAVPEEQVASYTRPTPALSRRYRDNHNQDISYLSVDQGLPSSYITDLLKDRHGNLWMATNGAGVVRYDGEMFQTFGQTQGLSSNYIEDLYEDSEGRIWMAGQVGGVTCFDGRTMKVFDTDSGLASNKAFSITEGKNGELWFGTRDGLSRYANGKFKTFTTEDGLLSDDILCLFFDSSEHLWIGTVGGISIYEDGKFSDFSDDYVYTILEDKAGNFWLGTAGDGLIRYDVAQRSTVLTTANGLSHDDIYTLYLDEKGRIWVGTYAGVDMISEGEITSFTEKNGLPDAAVTSILYDEAGIFWFGTDGGGLCRFKESSFEMFTEAQGLSSAIVWAIAEDSLGNILLATDADGLDIYDGEDFKRYFSDAPFSESLVSSLYTDQVGTQWVFTQSQGAYRYENGRWKELLQANGDPIDEVLKVEEDKETGELWFATKSGIVHYDGENVSILNEENGLPSAVTWSIKQDPNQKNTYWIATEEDGLIRYDGDGFEVFNTENALPSNHTYHLHFDQKGRLWVGTDEGIALFDGKTFQTFKKGDEQGLLHNLILSFEELPNGDIWVGTEGGLHWFKKVEDINEVPEGRRVFGEYQNFSFTKQDGLKSLDAIDNVVLLDSRNQLWWGMGNALTRLDLNTFSVSDTAPQLPKLLFVEVEQKYVDFSRLKRDTTYQNSFKFGKELVERYAACDTFFNRPIDLDLPYDLNHLTFHFSSIDWAAPHKVKYSYRLLGLEEEWSLPTEQNAVDYRGLPPSKYTLEVRAIGEAGKWSPVMRYDFRVRPPFWQTVAAKVLYVFLLIGLTFGIVSWRTRQLAKREKYLKKVVAERTQDLSKANTKLLKTNEEVRVINESLESTLHVVREQRDKIQDSINYAQRIQEAMLPMQKELDEALPNHFVFFRPRDVVSGDFYWLGDLRQVNGKVVVAAVDCTGHGVPGAFMSMIGNELLNRIVNELHIVEADKILEQLHLEVQSALKQKETRNRDGMDMSLVVIDQDEKTLTFAGAKNGLFYVQEGEPYWVKGNRQPIGGDWLSKKEQSSFQAHQISIDKPTFVYLFSDGFPDQFGGADGRKFMSKPFRELLLSLTNTQDMSEQKQTLADAFDTWKKGYEQLDDVLVMGLYFR
ncbi:MAG: two-component regulator propeller domain-containing protein [Bacteroidota bacterium]